jgi:phage-related protein
VKQFPSVCGVECIHEDMKAMPEDVRQVFGFALYLAQRGGKHPDAKPLKGFIGVGEVRTP